MENACDAVHITLNKNTIIGDKSAQTPGGIRIGTPAVTTRGYLDEDMKDVAYFLDETFKISLEFQAKKEKKLTDFRFGLAESQEIKDLNAEVHAFSCQLTFLGSRLLRSIYELTSEHKSKQ